MLELPGWRQVQYPAFRNVRNVTTKQTFSGNFVKQLKITRNRISKEQAEHMFSYRVRHDVASISMSNMWGSGVRKLLLRRNNRALQGR